MTWFRRRRKGQRNGPSHAQTTGLVAFTARQPPPNVAIRPLRATERADGALSARAPVAPPAPPAADPAPTAPADEPPPEPPPSEPADALGEPPRDPPGEPSDAPGPRPSGATMRIHEDRLDAPSPRIEMTPSEAMHLGTRGRRPSR